LRYSIIVLVPHLATPMTAKSNKSLTSPIIVALKALPVTLFVMFSKESIGGRGNRLVIPAKKGTEGLSS